MSSGIFHALEAAETYPEFAYAARAIGPTRARLRVKPAAASERITCQV